MPTTTKASKKKRTKVMSRRQQMLLAKKLAEIEAIEAELQRRNNMTNPMAYGLPDLLFAKDEGAGSLNPATGGVDREPLISAETDDEYRERQNHAVKKLIEIHLHFTKDGRRVDILLVPKQVAFISDFFYGRVKRGILWKGRGCGGSLCAAILIWLTMIYKCMSFIDLGGSMEQSRVVYEYVSAFWDAIPDMRENILSKDPLLSMTKLITGVQLKCIVPGTLVVSDRGLLPVENIKVGDRILDGKGNFSPVKMTVSRRHSGEVVRIVPVGYSRGISTTLDHKIWAMPVAQPVRRALQCGEAVAEKPIADWVEAKDLKVGDVLPVPKMVTDPSPKTIVLENLRSRCRGPKPLIALPAERDFYRFLGYFLADGSSHSQWINVSFGAHETSNIADCVSLIQSVLNRKACVLSRPNKNVRIVHFSFKALAEWLRANCGKRQEKQLPSWLLRQATDDELMALLTGLIRGDGGFHESVSSVGTKRAMQFTNTSSKLTQTVMLICQKFGFMGCLTLPKIRESTIRGYTFTGQQQYKWTVTGTSCDRLAKALNQGWGASKTKSFQQGWYDESYVYRPIKHVERYAYDGPVIDLVIDGHPSFTLPGALVHNCIPASEKMARGKHLPGLIADEASIVPGTLIRTRRGAMPIEQIVAGDVVLTRNGEWQPVKKAISHPYSGRIVRLQGCGDGIGAWITEEHRVFGSVGIGVTRKRKDRVYASVDSGVPAPDWHRAWDYDVGDTLSYPRFRRTGSLPDFIPSGDDKFWRFLGYWCGDGSCPITKTHNYPVKLYLGTAKQFFVPDAVECMTYVLGRAVRIEKFPSRSNSIDLVASSCKSWWKILRNVVGMADARGVPPEWLEAASDNDLRNFLVGLLRTDGGPQYRPDGVLSKWGWTGTSQHLAINTMYCMNRLGIPAYITTRESSRYGVKTKQRWDITVRWDYAKEILENSDFEGVSVPTKAFKSKQWCDDNYWYSVITKIDEDWYDGEVHDLQVAGDPSFGCPQRLMLHNCQDDPRADTTFKAAMQMSMSEPDHMILLLSTFHHPVGLFQEVWDTAETKGFARYRWNCFDVMTDCSVGMDDATPKDPKALGFCQTSCPLTIKEAIYDENDDLAGYQFVGCNGKARGSTGFLPRDNVINAMVLNEGTEIFRVEFACFPEGTPVMTSNGPREINHILAGDLALTHTGVFKRVLSTFERQYRGSLFSVNLAGYPQGIDVTPNHPFLVEKRKVVRIRGNRKEYAGTGIFDWVRADEISVGDLVRCPTWTAPGSSELALKKYTPSKGGTKVSELRIKLDPDAAWWLGLWTGDGYLDGTGIGLSLGDDKKHAPDRAIAVAKERLGISFSKSRFWKEERAWNVRGRSMGMSEWLKNNIGRYSYERQIPPVIFQSSDDIVLGYLEGLVAADGCIDARSVRIATTSEKLRHGICSLFNRLGIRVGTHSEKPGGFGVRKCHIVRLSRAAWDTRTCREHKEYITSRITSVTERSFAGPVFNIEVENDNSYVVGPAIVHNCERPQFSGPIYGLEAIENTLCETIEIDDANPTYVGIDWGVTEGALILGKDSPIDGPQVIDSRFLSVKLMSEYIRILTEWQEEYGPLEIYADSSHPFNIGDLEESNFEVTPVDFATMKDYGISNLLKMFMYGKIKILDDNKHLIDQLKSYRKDPKTGKPIKFNDHGPDALLCMTVIVDFLERWGDLLLARARGISRNQLQKTTDELGLSSKAKVDEKGVDKSSGVMLF